MIEDINKRPHSRNLTFNAADPTVFVAVQEALHAQGAMIRDVRTGPPHKVRFKMPAKNMTSLRKALAKIEGISDVEIGRLQPD